MHSSAPEHGLALQVEGMTELLDTACRDIDTVRAERDKLAVELYEREDVRRKDANNALLEVRAREEGFP